MKLEGQPWIVSVASSTTDLYSSRYVVWAETENMARWKALQRANEEWPQMLKRVWDVRLDEG